MPIEVTMPRLSDTMEQGTVVKWHVKVGDSVSAGDVLADIETDKATMELESFDEGTVAQLAVKEGKAIAVGSVILVIAEEGEDAGDAAEGAASAAPAQAAAGGSPTPSQPAASTAVAEPPPEPTQPAGTNGTSRAFASPLARKLAAESGVDLSRVQGSGPGGRIVRKDVESATGAGTAIVPASPAPTPSSSVGAPLAPAMDVPTGLEHAIVPLSNMRGTIARRLVESKTSIPHYQVTLDVDMDALVELRAQLNDQLSAQAVKLTVNDFIVRACALAMHEHPFVNARWLMQENQPAIEILPEVNVGVAIALPVERGGGLVVATIRNADRLGLRQISAETRRLATKAREKGLSIEEMADSTFTISNLGMFGVEHFTAIINPPNAAILAVGAAIEKPVVKNGLVVPGWRMQMTMSSDHRIIDGAMAAAFLGSVRDSLEAPATLLV